MNKKTTQNQKNAYAINFTQLMLVAVFMLSAFFAQAQVVNSITRVSAPEGEGEGEETCVESYTVRSDGKGRLNFADVGKPESERAGIDNVKEGDSFRYSNYLVNDADKNRTYDLILTFDVITDDKSMFKVSAATTKSWLCIKRPVFEKDPYVVVSYYFVKSGDEAKPENAVTVKNYTFKLKNIASTPDENHTDVVGVPADFDGTYTMGVHVEEGGFVGPATGINGDYKLFRAKSNNGDFTEASKDDFHYKISEYSDDYAVTFTYQTFTHGKIIYGATGKNHKETPTSDNYHRYVIYDFGPGACIKDNIPTDIQSAITASENVRVYSDARNVVVHNSQETTCDVAVYDVSGRLIARRVVDAQSTAYLPVQTQGVYIVKVVNNHGVTTQRVMVR